MCYALYKHPVARMEIARQFKETDKSNLFLQHFCIKTLFSLLVVSPRGNFRKLITFIFESKCVIIIIYLQAESCTKIGQFLLHLLSYKVHYWTESEHLSFEIFTLKSSPLLVVFLVTLLSQTHAAWWFL